jgi:hypothetical protein
MKRLLCIGAYPFKPTWDVEMREGGDLLLLDPFPLPPGHESARGLVSLYDLSTFHSSICCGATRHTTIPCTSWVHAVPETILCRDPPRPHAGLFLCSQNDNYCTRQLYRTRTV